jgi:isopropylmalate/homocitrate/citramalate synthase
MGKEHREGLWEVSPYNFDKGIRAHMNLPAKVIVMDSTLRPEAVGERAFSHGAEVHYVLPEGDKWSFNAWAPEVVGNKAHVALCQDTGPRAIQRKARELGLGEINDAVAAEILAKVRSELRFRRQKLSDDLFTEIVRAASTRAGR